MDICKKKMICLRLRAEASYLSVFLILWAVALAILSWISGFPGKGLIILVFSGLMLTSPHAETRILFPMVFLSKCCLDDVIVLGHSSMEFYASIFFSYLTFVTFGGGRMEGCGGRTFWEVIMHAAGGLVMGFFSLEDGVTFFSVGVFVLSGFLFFCALRPILGEDESVLVGSLVGFYICDVVTNNTPDEGKMLPHACGPVALKTDVVGRGVVLGAICMVIVLFSGSRLCMDSWVDKSNSSQRHVSVRRMTILYYVALMCIVVGMHATMSLRLKETALLWLIRYIASSCHRICALITWAIAVPLCTICVEKFTGGLRKTVRRKMFHFIAVALFTPVALVDPSFLSLSLSVASGLAVFLELARFYGVYGSSAISRFVSGHIDDRDAIDGAVRTHIYLIYGLGVSMALRCRHEEPHLTVGVLRVMEFSINLIPGIVALGVVDACSAIVGSTFLLSHRRTLGEYLNNRIFTERANPSVTHKTNTGTLGGLLCGAAFWMFILLLTGTAKETGAGYSFILVLVSSLAECFLDGVDNLQLPLVVMGVANTLFAFLLQSCKEKTAKDHAVM